MPADLATNIRDLIDTTEPVTAEEAILWSATHTSASTWSPSRSHARTVAAVAAGVLVVGGAGAALAAASAKPAPIHSLGAPVTPHAPPMILTAARLHHIVASSTASSSTGTAEVTDDMSYNGSPESDETIAVTFDGANIDEKIGVDPQPAGSAPDFTTDDRLVDGTFYIYTPGPNDVSQWAVDTNSASDRASMQFPDPRTLYGAISASADFAVVGTTTSNGVTLTELEAQDPGAIQDSALAPLSAGTITSFEIWVDQNDVVQQMAFSSSDTEQGCTFAIGSSTAIRKLKGELKGTSLKVVDGPGGKVAIVMPARHAAASGAASCGEDTTSDLVTISFANLGAPESVVAPVGAVPYAGKG